MPSLSNHLLSLFDIWIIYNSDYVDHNEYFCTVNFSHSSIIFP